MSRSQTYKLETGPLRYANCTHPTPTGACAKVAESNVIVKGFGGATRRGSYCREHLLEYGLVKPNETVTTKKPKRGKATKAR